MRLRILPPLLVLICCSMVSAGNRTLEDLKQLKGFTQKSGAAVAAINSPQFVPAAQAKIPDNAWVIGVHHNGVARAYSMNLMNRYVVVNDRVGDQAIALIWDPMANVAAAYNRNVDGQDLEFNWPAALYHSSMVLADAQTKSYWSGVTGEALGGSKQGVVLERLPIVVKTLFGDWKKRHPNTEVLSQGGQTHEDSNPYAGFMKSPDPLMPPVKANKTLPPKTSVYGLTIGGKHYAIAHEASAGGWKGKAGKTSVFVFRPPNAPPYYGTVAYDLGSVKLKKKGGAWVDKSMGALNPITGAFEKGDMKLKPLNGVDTFWYVWTGYHAKPKLLNPPRRKRSEFQTETAASINAGDDPTLKK